MSYDILYKTAFIKLETKPLYLPMLLSGSSNVYNYNNKGRARDWQMFTLDEGGSKLVSRDKYMSIIDDIENRYSKEYPDEYEPKRLGWYSSISIYGKKPYTTTKKNLVGFFTRAFDKAITFEQLKNLGCAVVIRTSTWCENAKRLGVSDYVICDNEIDFINNFDIFFKRYSLDGVSYYVTFTTQWEGLAKRIETTYFPKEPIKRLPKPVSKNYTVSIEGKYLVRYGKRWIRYSHKPSKFFATHSQAEMYIKGKDSRLKIVKLDGQG